MPVLSALHKLHSPTLRCTEDGGTWSSFILIFETSQEKLNYERFEPCRADHAVIASATKSRNMEREGTWADWQARLPAVHSPAGPCSGSC